MFRIAFLIVIAQLPAWCADWSPRLAAEYLDSRQKEWAAWPQAAAQGGTCFSCHTGMTYLLARPALRRVLGENQPTWCENAALDGLRARVGRRDPKEGFGHFTKEPLSSEALGVEAIFAAMFLRTEPAFDRMWALQIREGKEKGAWHWFELDLDPWETTESPYYGAALAAIAVGAAPAEYRGRPDVQERISALTAYLQGEQSSQPLHNRLMLLWAGRGLPGLVSEASRKSLIDEVFSRQQTDGGWTLESLGPWKARPQARAAVGSNAYATGFTAFILTKTGVHNAQLDRALGWLRTHQNARGYWDAASMNKRFEPGSMQDQFMRDAATGFAALALADAARE